MSLVRSLNIGTTGIRTSHSLKAALSEFRAVADTALQRKP